MISVIMPAYNAECYLREAVQSVTGQTFADWELLIVNDGSTDGTALLAEELRREDRERIRLLNTEKNAGVAAARMLGVKEAGGEWIAFLDSDDAWEPEKLQKQADLAARTGAGLIYTGSAFMDEKGNRLEHILKVPERMTYRRLLKQNLVSCSSVMVKKDWMLRFPMKSFGTKVKGRMHEDFASWLCMLRAGCKACAVNEPLLIYRVRAGSVSGDKKKAAAMTWRVYRNIGLPLPEALYYFMCYALRSVMKWRKL